MAKIKTPNAYIAPRTSLFEAKVCINQERFFLGAHLTAGRASIAVRLFKLWVERGYRPSSIPTKTDYILCTGPLMKRKPRKAYGAPCTPVIGFNPVTKQEVRFVSMADAEKEGFDASGICKCCKGKFKHHAGYQWRYDPEYL